MDKETFEKAIELYNEMQAIQHRRYVTGIADLTEEEVEKLILSDMLSYVSILDQPLRERIKAVVKECLIEYINTNPLEEIEKEIEKL